VRFQQIQKYECAANRMSAARLWQLSEVLEVPVSYFYEGLSLEQREAMEAGEAAARCSPARRPWT
jgi:transcriptional regulator with XRE-family HTH domain